MENTLKPKVEWEAYKKAELAKVEPLATQTRRFEQGVIKFVLELCEGNWSDAAAHLGIARTTLYRELQSRRKP